MHKSPYLMRKFVHKELLMLVLEGHRERWEKEVGGPFHGPIAKLAQQDFTFRYCKSTHIPPLH